MCIRSEMKCKWYPGQKSCEAYRNFRVIRSGDTIHLGATNQSTQYTTRYNQTKDDPDANADFGFHSYKKIGSCGGSHGNHIRAKIHVGGTVVEHATGYRSTVMVILTLYIPRFQHQRHYTLRDIRKFAKRISAAVELV